MENTVSENQKRINDLISEYKNAHNKQNNFNIELPKRDAQSGFELLNYGHKAMSKFK